MKRKTIYIENSIISYLAARPSTNLIAAAWQHVTHDWWEKRRHLYSLCISQAVVDEVGKGDAGLAQIRLRFLENIAEIPLTNEVRELTRSLLSHGVLPEKAAFDAIHIAAAAVHEIDFLLTWNCSHIANADIIPVVKSICVIEGYSCPEIRTPQEMMGEDEYD
ncbi:MAG: type II toxin-antitoxin system VapC family toxin [Candidatus Sumerlaeota bacterium]|nr:type II toxin-antitoxin system VapC family toxin [Candidatus Sumerlaeota bacterium]